MDRFSKTVTSQWPDKASSVLDLIDGKIDPMSYSSVAEWVRSCYHAPSFREQMMKALNELLNGYGVEMIEPWQTQSDSGLEEIDDWISFINMGDSYAATIIFDNDTNLFYCCSMADFIETYKETLKIDTLTGEEEYGREIHGRLPDEYSGDAQ